MYPPPLPLVHTDINPSKLARLVRDAREVGLIDGAEFAAYLADRIFPRDPRRAMQFINLADPAAHNAERPIPGSRLDHRLGS